MENLIHKHKLKIQYFIKRNKNIFDLDDYDNIAYQYSLLLDYFSDKNVDISRYRKVFKDMYIHSDVKDIFNKIKKYYNLSNAFTYKKSILRYGEFEGKIKWDEYRKKQSKTNTFEYKKEKYNWSREDFDNFNKSRAITKENLIKKYGNDKGLDKWQDYKNKQSYSGISKDYFIKKHGNDLGLKVWKEVNNKKAHNYENYIRIYGDEKTARKKLEQHYHKISSNSFHSKISQELFWELYNNIKNFNINVYFAELNTEFVKFDVLNNKIRKFDFVIPELYYCVEFNGDEWHANPKFYSDNDTPKIFRKKSIKPTSKDIWKNDEEKNRVLTDIGYNVKVVWENDYRENKELIIGDILQEIYDVYENRKKF